MAVFRLGAPFWITSARSFARLLWIWGWPAVLVLFLSGDRRFRRGALAALAWIGIALVPYSFLTYSTQIPSRQVYLASAGLALLVGLALAKYEGRRIAAALFALMLLHNTVYLWTKKRAQFVERAAPTDQLIALAERTRHGRSGYGLFPLPRPSSLKRRCGCHRALAIRSGWKRRGGTRNAPSGSVPCFRLRGQSPEVRH